MCKVVSAASVESLPEEDRSSPSATAFLMGRRAKAGVGTAITNNILDCEVHLRCEHEGGRTDEYHLKPGEALSVDEDAVLTILNPRELHAAARAMKHSSKHGSEPAAP